MPLGDPGGGRFEYTTEGIPETILASEIPVSDVPSSVRFYTNVLKLEKISEDPDTAVLRLGSDYVILRKSQHTGIDTGLYLGVRDTFEFHRRMVDDNVIFVRHPQRGPIGVYASFRDPDANVLHAVEINAAVRTRNGDANER